MPPQETVQQETDAVWKALQGFPEGAVIEEIERALAVPPLRRTLGRRLAKMAADGRVTLKGKGRATRYIASAEPLQNIDTGATIPLSAQAQRIRRTVNLPKNQRTPVGYNRDFLERYIPNKTPYLSEAERTQLHTMGRTAGTTQPAGTYAKQILHRLLIDLSWNSSRLEGNTYSLLETERLLSFGEVAAGKSAQDAQMILNHKDAIEFLVESAVDIGFNRYTILNLHALLANNLLPDPQAVGRLRHIAVGIGGSVFEPLSIPQQINDYFDIILHKASAIEDPFEQAFFVMVQLPYLQPFDDVNKRVSRLSINIPLLKHNLAPLSFVDVPDQYYIQGILGVYELNRIDLLKDVFLWAYGRSAARYSALRQNIGEPDPLRLKYRTLLQTVIHQIVSDGLRADAAAVVIHTSAESLPENDRSRFRELVETDLLGLNEGNCARYRVDLQTFLAWHERWK
ncbi:MAG: Fic family protein [Holosporales bacterium]|jgi:hypothetical protein